TRAAPPPPFGSRLPRAREILSRRASWAVQQTIGFQEHLRQVPQAPGPNVEFIGKVRADPPLAHDAPPAVVPFVFDLVLADVLLGPQTIAGGHIVPARKLKRANEIVPFPANRAAAKLQAKCHPVPLLPLEEKARPLFR